MATDGPPQSPESGEVGMAELLRRIRVERSETARPSVFCFKCEHVTEVDETTAIPDSLRGRPPVCAKCGVPLDVWKHCRQVVSTGGGLAFAAPLGPRLTLINYRLPINGIAAFGLHENGVPADAQLLQIVHRAHHVEGVLATDLVNTDHGWLNSDCLVFGAWVGDGQPPAGVADAQGSTSVLWARHDQDDIGRRSLIDALEAFIHGRPRQAIVPANVAVEVTLGRVLAKHLEAVGIGEKRVREFLANGATYGHQVNVLLPALLHSTGAPPMPEHVRGALNKLRDLRNDLAHEGEPEKPLTPAVLAECIVGAAFGFHYMRIADEYLMKLREGAAVSV